MAHVYSIVRTELIRLTPTGPAPLPVQFITSLTTRLISYSISAWPLVPVKLSSVIFSASMPPVAPAEHTEILTLALASATAIPQTAAFRLTPTLTPT